MAWRDTAVVGRKVPSANPPVMVFEAIHSMSEQKGCVAPTSGNGPAPGVAAQRDSPTVMENVTLVVPASGPSWSTACW